MSAKKVLVVTLIHFLCWPAVLLTAQTREIGYIRPEAPEYNIPAYHGLKYTDTAPNTFELAEMAKLALHGLTGPLDPKSDYELYFMVYFFRNPPAMSHDFSDVCLQQLLPALVLNRIITGSDYNMYVERALIESFLKSIGADGMYHQPVKGKPWLMENMWPDVREDFEASLEKEGYMGGTICPKFIEAMLLYYLRDQNPMWKETVELMIKNGIKNMVDKGDWGYLGSPDKIPMGQRGVNPWIIQSFVQAYKTLGYEPALKAAGKFIKHDKDYAGYFDKEGRFTDTHPEFQPGAKGAHFHKHALSLLAFLEYALVANDHELIEFVKTSYEWAKKQGSDLTGYFPENIKPDNPNSEGCPVADMIALALFLSKNGVGDYWDDADRWLRNYFAEIQLTPAAAKNISRMCESMPEKDIAYNETGDRVIERNIGAFAGWPAPNDWVYKIGIQHCCTGSCARAIYYAWENVIYYDDGQIRVNLLMNHASSCADVYSYIPYKGQVDVRLKTACKTVMIRVPEWIEAGSKEVICTINNKPQTFTWAGRYVNIGKVKKGKTVSVKFPISERTVKERIGGIECTLIIKGNTVVFIDPPGKNCPLYQRKHYEKDQVRWRKADRFVSDEIVDW